MPCCRPPGEEWPPTAELSAPPASACANSQFFPATSWMNITRLGKEGKVCLVTAPLPRETIRSFPGTGSASHGTIRAFHETETPFPRTNELFLSTNGPHP